MARSESSVAATRGTGSLRVPVTLSLAIAALAVLASLVGLLDDGAYARETPNWQGQALGQDAVNLVAYPLLAAVALAGRSGSVRLRLVWAGILTYSAYTYAIYAFSIHFGALFPVYVAVLGLSVYALILVLRSVDASQLPGLLGPRAPVRTISALLIGIGVMFAGLWLSEIIPSVFNGEVPESLVTAGLATNPVHVLDLGILLPAAVIASVGLRRRHPWGFLLTPVVLTATVLLSLGIIAAIAVLAGRGETASWPVAGIIGVVAIAEATAVWRLLRSGSHELP